MENQKTILLIDDDPRNIFALSAVLRSRGFRLLAASSAREGMALLKREHGISVVLLDMMMPDMDGYEALRALKEEADRPTVPIFAVTAQAMVGDRERCLKAGADEYVPKPVDVDLLLSLLKTYNAV